MATLQTGSYLGVSALASRGPSSQGGETGGSHPPLALGNLFGASFILDNNAGITRDTLLPRMSDQEWDDVLNASLRGAFLMTRAVSRLMLRARYGRIISVSSKSGLIRNPGQTNYSASKVGLIGLTRSLSRELAGRKVKVNAAASGFIESEMTATLGEALLEEAKKRIPAKRLKNLVELCVVDLCLYFDDVDERLLPHVVKTEAEVNSHTIPPYLLSKETGTIVSDLAQAGGFCQQRGGRQPRGVYRLHLVTASPVLGLALPIKAILVEINPPKRADAG